MEEQFFTVLAAAQYLGVSRDKIHYMLSNGKLEASVDPLDSRRKLIKKTQLEAIKHRGNVVTPEDLTASSRLRVLNLIYLKGETDMQDVLEETTKPSTEKDLSEDKLVHCSFCGKDQKQVAFVVAGPKVYICDECITLAHKIIQDIKEPKE